jgi:long-subunit fatty acid transport protein
VSRDDLFDVETWVTTLRVSRRFTERLSGFAVASYFDQQNRRVNSVGSVQDQNRYEIGVGLTYAFRPIRL